MIPPVTRVGEVQGFIVGVGGVLERVVDRNETEVIRTRWVVR